MLPVAWAAAGKREVPPHGTPSDPTSRPAGVGVEEVRIAANPCNPCGGKMAAHAPPRPRRVPANQDGVEI